jgi:putative ABC transport system permease protein
MTTTSLIIWLRNIRRAGMHSAVNIAGLALGLCAVVAIFLYVNDELSYDRFHVKGDRIFRINSTSRFAGSENRYPTTGAPLADAIRSDIAAVEQVARTFERQAALQVMQPEDPSRSDLKFREEHFYFADPAILNIFSFNFLAGDASSALDNPTKLLINESTAVRYFGSATESIGRQFLFEGNVPLTVSAVFADYPTQSHLQINMIAHFENYYAVEPEDIRNYLRRDWIYNTVSTYVMPGEEADARSIEKQINDLKRKYADDRVINGVTYEMQPLKNIHLFSEFSFGNESANIMYVSVLGVVGMLILVIASVNFINLSTVHSLTRAREIGIRKVLGAKRGRLMFQFLLESAGVVLISFILGILFLYVALPLINDAAGKNFKTTDLFAPEILTGLVVLFLITAILAGTYPSFYVTRFNPVDTLKGVSHTPSGGGLEVRRVLVVVQFTVSICLVVLSIIFYNQMEFVRGKPLGFLREGMLVVPLFSSNPNSILGGGVDGPLRGRMNSLETELLREGAVESVTVSSALPGLGAVFALVQTDSIKEEDNVFVAATAVDYDFLDCYKMQLVAGRGFSRDFGTDHLQAVVINEQAVTRLGWKSPLNAIGKSIAVMGKNATVVGVVKDFHFQGLQQPLRPLILEVAASKFTVFSMRLNPANPIGQSIDHIKTLWDKTFPEKVFEYHFLDDRLAVSYGNEQRLTKMMQYFSVLAIFISALGVFGLSAFINHQRSKEVSIRKVLGASRSQIFATLSRDFIAMATFGFIVAIPLAYFLANEWLATFAYRTGVGWSPFLIGGSVSLLIVLLTISYETLRATNVNPAERLRAE